MKLRAATSNGTLASDVRWEEVAVNNLVEAEVLILVSRDCQMEWQCEVLFAVENINLKWVVESETKDLGFPRCYNYCLGN